MGRSNKHASRSQIKKNRRRNMQRDLVTADDMQIYGVVEKPLGEGRFECICSDGVERQCHVRGKMYKRVFIQKNDTLLISLREEEPEKGDIIQKYFPNEIHALKKMNEFSARDFVNKDDPEQVELAEEDSCIQWVDNDIDEI